MHIKESPNGPILEYGPLPERQSGVESDIPVSVDQFRNIKRQAQMSFVEYEDMKDRGEPFMKWSVVARKAVELHFISKAMENYFADQFTAELNKDI